MSALGIDIGNDTSVIAAYKRNAVEIIDNEGSGRDTPTLVSFAGSGGKQRLFGSSAAATLNRSPYAVVSNFKRLVGRRFEDSYLQRDICRLPFNVIPAVQSDGALVQVPFNSRGVDFTPTQVLAMFLSHLKKGAQGSLQAEVSDCVLAIPSYFTVRQRRDYLDAARLAGLNPIGFMHELTAAALDYGIYKNDLPPPAYLPPRIVMFVDVGHCGTQVAVVAFSEQGMKVLSHTFDANLGGWDFDEVLYDHFVGLIKDKFHLDVESSDRAKVKVRVACKKIKKDLTANAEATLSIDCLMNDIDVYFPITRDKFEEMCEGLLQRVAKPCEEALKAAHVKEESLHSLELVGHGSRIPAITKRLSILFGGRELNRTLNAAECIARGCAIQCAMLSKKYKVRQYEVQDVAPFSLQLTIMGNPDIPKLEKVLSSDRLHLPSIKMLILHRNSTFIVGLSYLYQGESPPEEDEFKIGLKAEDDNSQVKVRLQLLLYGIAIVDASKLPVTSRVHGGAGEELLETFRKTEIELVKQDNLIEQRKERKNALESLVYEIRNKLSESSWDPDRRIKVEEYLKETEKWLHDGDRDIKDYNDMLNHLQKVVVDQLSAHNQMDVDDEDANKAQAVASTQTQGRDQE